MSIEENFIEYIEDYKNLILKVASMYCRGDEDRKDLVQEIILQLWRAYPNYNGTYAISTWTYRIALNVSISFVRKTSTRNKAILQYKKDIELVVNIQQNDDQRRRQLYDAIQFLKPLDKAIIGLHIEGCKNKEISIVLGISPSNVSTRIARIKQQLKNNFSNT